MGARGRPRATRYVIDSTAWVAYLRGTDERLREIIEDHWPVMTADVCVREIVSWLSSHGREPTSQHGLISLYHESVRCTPDLVARASSLDKRQRVGVRLTLAIAERERATAVFCEDQELRLVPHDRIGAEPDHER